MKHHHRVALMSVKLGKAAGMTEAQLWELFQAAVIHDIGAFSWREKESLLAFNLHNPWEHCTRGYLILNRSGAFQSLAAIIQAHHDHWAGNNPSGFRKNGIPLASRIIHLTDRVDVLIQEEKNILDQGPHILAQIRPFAGKVFDPELVALLAESAWQESFWLDLVSPWSAEQLVTLVPAPRVTDQINTLVDLARLFAGVVDATNPFTYRHSRGVAMVAELLAEKLNFSPADQSLLKIAGLLHDLGKLTVPVEILEKPGRLTPTECNLIKRHPYYTYWLLRPVWQNHRLANWAAYHHESLNGHGYPFHLTAPDLDTGSRLVKVADVFTALREDRPYRDNLPWAGIEQVFGRHIARQSVDRNIATVLFDHRHDIDYFWDELTSELLPKT
ncbi:MAG: HD domain-containing protein [Heliobacteriaceae bacterium]|nr:HD domain-containing protein [Heliobacteriaceae bacterium]